LGRVARAFLESPPLKTSSVPLSLKLLIVDHDNT